ncbi:hypothetical protein [Konateibacter massiliensis]|uniref:hypothetical protein n=1 Tax=Konateibacter massiliensis TaxID=2002841 RepID=UPI000C14C84A|nr:hypothetical protein [Konateibacter massiliensis]
MNQQNYKVILETPLGNRNGILELNISKTKIDGYLYIFKNREPVTGELSSDGSCRLRGKFVTLMSEFYYEATGRIDCDYVDLILHGRSSVFQMKGIASTQAEQHKEEEHELH